jgi:hypothetical protein
VISPLKPSQKFEKFADVYAQLSAEFQSSGHAKLMELADVWAKSLSQMRAILNDVKPSVNRSALTAGLEQGLRETPLILSSLPEIERNSALKIFRRIVQTNVPNFFAEEREAREKVIARGKIKNEREWYLLRHRVDEIEGDASQASELAELYKLLGTYENAA